jgi:two-component system chemotaxis sensor kinase CheA
VEQTQYEFSAELEERVELLFAAIDELRKRLADGPTRRELLDRVFRNTHNIKGTAATFGLKRVGEIAHEFENSLALVRSGGASLDESALDHFEESAQLMLDQLTGAERPPAAELSSESARWLKSEGVLNTLPPELKDSLTEEQRWNLITALDEGANLLIVSANFEVRNFDEQFRQLQERLKRRGEVISSSPTPLRSEQPARITFRIVYVSKVDWLALRSEFEQSPDVGIELLGTGHSLPAITRHSELQTNLIQVKLSDLDHLAASAHDLFRQTTDVLELALAERDEAPKLLADSIESLREKFMAVEDEIVSLRMVPVARTLQRAVRAGRSAARASGKTIDFETSGADMRMDRLLVNAIGDPLIHLVRNAVDHGIETEEERIRRGKHKRGKIRIEVASDGGQSIVTVSDDGRGVHPEAIARAAAEFGIIAEGAAIDLEQSLRLIFRPGFSSVQSVSGVSGRGVGLDVVETAVEQVGGKMRVSTEVDKGTVFEIVLPVSFGLLNSTILRSENYYYCLDASLICGCDAIESRQAEAGGASQVKAAGESWPILHLRSLLGQSPGQLSVGSVKLLHCEFRGQTGNSRALPTRLGLIVDDVEGTEEVLVRGLGSHGGRWRGIAGATELRNGRVALVLDLPRLIESRSADSSLN